MVKPDITSIHVCCNKATMAVCLISLCARAASLTRCGIVVVCRCSYLLIVCANAVHDVMCDDSDDVV